MMQELHKLYADIPVPPQLKEDILAYCRTAQEKPKPIYVRYVKPLALIAACVAVMLVSLTATGHLFGGDEGANLPVGVPESSVHESAEPSVENHPENATTTTFGYLTTTVHANITTKGTMNTTVHKQAATQGSTATTTVRPSGVGGDENVCDKHVMFYHSIDGRLEVLVGPDKVTAYLQENGWLNTSQLTKEEREQITVVHFLKYFGITKQEFISAMAWTDILDEKAQMSGYFNENYTYREIADALYSDDRTLIDQVFARESPQP